MTFVFGTILLCTGTVLEATCGLKGLSLPFVLLSAFYVFTAHKSRPLFFVGCLCAMFTDIHFLRPGLPTLLLMPAVLGLANFWRETGDISNPFILFLPGCAIGMGHCVILFVFNCLAVHTVSAIHPLVFLTDILAPAFLLPVLAVFFDQCALRAGLPRLYDARPTRRKFYAARKTK